jgi:hypothetical protein
MVAILVFDELKVNVVFTGLPAAFTANALMVTTCPATSEIVAGLTVTDATVLLLEEELPPHPATTPGVRLIGRGGRPTSRGGVTSELFKLVSAFVPLPVSREHELEGRDISQRGRARH